MLHRRLFYLLCGVIFMSMFLILYKLQHPYKNHREVSFLDAFPTQTDGSPNIEVILEKTRLKIKNDLSNYNFTYSGVSKLEELLQEHGGMPLRTLVIAGWRHGSTFFAELLNAMPGNFYHYEPLLKYNIRQIRGPPYGAEATQMLKKMLHCNYSGMDDYFEYGKKHLNYLNQFKHNTRLWDQCKHNIELCYDSDFTAKYCKLFPFQSMKVVRYRLRLVQNILSDKSLNVKAVLLTRDPRGVMQSRRNRHYCQPSPDCIDPELVCSDMISDYVAAGKLIDKYPGRVMVLRFEDLALNLAITTRHLQQFLKLGHTHALDEFLHTHTNVEAGGVDATFRITHNVPFKWKKALSYDYVNQIQVACKDAMELWGYRLAHNASHMSSEHFFPLKSYSVQRIKKYKKY